MSGPKQAKLCLVDEETGDQIDIGHASVEQYADGRLECRVTVSGDCTMSSNNLAGMTRLRVYIPAALRKN